MAQSGEGNIDHPISFASRKLSTIEKNYTMIEREGLAMVYALQKFRHYLLGSHFKMFTDHSALKYLVNNLMLGGRICRWLLLFQEFEEVYFLCTFWNSARSHCMQARIDGGSCEDSIRSQLHRVAAELCSLSQDINRNIVTVDVASLLEANHVNHACYEVVHVIAFCYYFLLSIIYYMDFSSG